MSLSGYPLEIGQSARPPVAKDPRSGDAFAVNKQSTEMTSVTETPLSLTTARWLRVQVELLTFIKGHNQRVAYRLGKLSNAEISDFSASRRVSRVEPPISSTFDKLGEGSAGEGTLARW